MARTKRWPFSGRKIDRWVLRVWLDEVNPIDVDWSASVEPTSYTYRVYLRSDSVTGKRCLAKAVSDSIHRRGPPRDWIRMYHKSDRAKAREELFRFIVNPEHEVMIEANHRHKAKWDWY